MSRHCLRKRAAPSTMSQATAGAQVARPHEPGAVRRRRAGTGTSAALKTPRPCTLRSTAVRRCRVIGHDAAEAPGRTPSFSARSRRSPSSSPFVACRRYRPSSQAFHAPGSRASRFHIDRRWRHWLNQPQLCRQVTRNTHPRGLFSPSPICNWPSTNTSIMPASAFPSRYGSISTRLNALNICRGANQVLESAILVTASNTGVIARPCLLVAGSDHVRLHPCCPPASHSPSTRQHRIGRCPRHLLHPHNPHSYGRPPYGDVIANGRAAGPSRCECRPLDRAVPARLCDRGQGRAGIAFHSRNHVAVRAAVHGPNTRLQPRQRIYRMQ